MGSQILFELMNKKCAQDRNALPLLTLVSEIVDSCKGILKGVITYFPEYTLHDETHSENVAEIMVRLIPTELLENLHPLELASLILSAYLHDIGMSPSRLEVDSLLNSEKSEDKKQYEKFRSGFPLFLNKQKQLQAKKCFFEAQELEGYLLSEYLRKTHGARGKDYIYNKFYDKFTYKGFNFGSRLGEICFSHTVNHTAVDNIPCYELIHSSEYVNWRFIAIILRLADILDFDPKRTPGVLFNHLGIRSSVSILEWKKHLAVTGLDITENYIGISAQCNDPVIEKTIRDFTRIIEAELQACKLLALDMHDRRAPNLSEKYKIAFPIYVDTRDVRPAVGPSGPLYKYVDLKFTLDQDRILALVMGVALYAQKVLFLRELLQNAVDACRYRQAYHSKDSSLGEYLPRVEVRLEKSDDGERIVVEDNGIGMDEFIVSNYFAKVGTSYYRSTDFYQDRAENNLDFLPISQFGIGVLSVFMVSEKMHVETRRFNCSNAPISIEIAESGSLFWFRKSTKAYPGTTITVDLNVSFDEIIEFNKYSRFYGNKTSADKLYQVVSSLAMHVDIPINVSDGKEHKQLICQWELPNVNTEKHTPFTVVDIDLSIEAPAGLNGLIRVFILTENGKFVIEKKYCDEDDDYYDEDGEDLRNYLQHSMGHINQVHVDKTVKEGISHGYSVFLRPDGKLSQQGFAVPYPLFGEHDTFSKSGPSLIDYPLPIHFDIDLSGEFVLPLTADRKTIIPTIEAQKVVKKINKLLTQLLFKKLGKTKVKKNAAFFETLCKKEHFSDDTKKKSLFLEVLNGFLGK